jgi:hypothetical protein
MGNFKNQKSVSDYISNLSESDFITFCDRLLHQIFPSAVQSCSIIDNDYTIIQDNLFLPVPAEFENKKSIAELLPSDIKQLAPRIITFLSNDSFILSQAQKNHIKKTLNDTRIEVWGLPTLELKLNSLEHEDLIYVIGRESAYSAYLSSTHNPDEEINIIHNIFSYIKQNAVKQPAVPSKQLNIYSGIMEKAKLNFKEHRQRVLDMYQLTYYHKSLVEKYFQETTKYDKSEVIVLREFFRSKYCSITNYPKSTYPVNDFKFLEMLSELCLETQFKSNINYQHWAKAIVMYFFEYCDFGARNEDDIFKSKNPDMFENLNEDIS